MTRSKDWINVGVYAFAPEILQDVEYYPESELFPYLIQHNKLQILYQQGYALNINTPVDLFRANMALFEHTIVQSHFAITNTCSISPSSNSKVHETYTIGDSVIIGQDVIIEPNVQVEKCVILPQTKINSGAKLRQMIIGPNGQVLIEG